MTLARITRIARISRTSIAVLVVAFIATAAACTTSTNDETANIAAEQENTSKATSELYVLSTQVWPSPHIPVCWENDGYELEKQWIREALENSWEVETNVTFDTWTQCSTVPANYGGLRVRFADSSTRGLGKALAGVVNGVDITDFRRGELCRLGSKELCIKAETVHEFGHALSFSHEHNRNDRPGEEECYSLPQGPNGDTKVGSFDMNSVMNYCNLVYCNNGKPSATDIRGAQQYYGGPLSISAASWGANNEFASVFVRDTNNRIRGRIWNKEWLHWITLNSAFEPATGSPHAVSWAGGSKISVFTRRVDGQLWMRTWNVGVDTSLEPWQSLDMNILGSPTAVSWNDGSNLSVFVRDTNRHLWTRVWNGSSWGTWENLGTDFTGTPSVVTTKGGTNLSLFARKFDGHLWTRSWDGSWSAWNDLGDRVAGEPIAVTTNGGNRITVFANDVDGNLRTRSWAGAWGSWQTIGSSLTASPRATASPDGSRIDVFSRGLDGQLWMRTWNGSWGAWESIGTDMVGSAGAIYRSDGSLNVFRLNSSKELWTRERTSSWGTWLLLGSPFI